MTIKIRWKIAYALNRLHGQCWADLALWAVHHRYRSPWSPVTDHCRFDLDRRGCCYCGKLRASGDRAVSS